MAQANQHQRNAIYKPRAIVIGVAGTHSTGKTTFIEKLRDEFEARGLRVKLVSDLAIAARDSGFGILREHTYESTLWILSRGISEELAAATRSDIVLVDRPVPDALGYLNAALMHRGASLSKEERQYLHTVAQGHATRYDLIFKTVIDHSVPIDKTKERDFDVEYRAQVAAQIDMVFDEFKLPSYRLVRTEWASAIALCIERAAAQLGVGLDAHETH